MALPINIADLINRRVVENARVEYKGNWNPEPILHSICAFANDIDNWGWGFLAYNKHQIRHILSLQGVELIEVPLTGNSLHIDGAIVMIDHDKALVNIERLPYWFIDKIKSLNI